MASDRLFVQAGDAREIAVVTADDDPAQRQSQVGLDEVGAGGDRPFKGETRVLEMGGRVTTVGNRKEFSGQRRPRINPQTSRATNWTVPAVHTRYPAPNRTGARPRRRET